jgi:hypothetical protein
MDITPLENACADAYELAAGIAALGIIQGLIAKGDEASVVMLDRNQSIQARLEAKKELTHVNMLLDIIAKERAVYGIQA